MKIYHVSLERLEEICKYINGLNSYEPKELFVCAISPKVFLRVHKENKFNNNLTFKELKEHE